MKICFLAPANSVHSYRWIKYFAEKGHQVHWISLYPAENDGIEGVGYYQLKKPSNLLEVLGVIKEVRKLLREIAPEILHVHSAALYGLVGIASGFHPVVLTAWGSDILTVFRSPVRKILTRYILKNADLITTDADHMIAAMLKLGADRSRIKLVYFGIDTDKFSPHPGNAAMRSSLGLREGEQAVFSIRNFLPVHNVESLVKAADIVTRSNREVKFIIAGAGPLEADLKALSGRLGADERINFIGKIDNSRLPEFLGAMDLYVSTSLSDAGISASTAEAMACGLAVVITDSGENRKWVSDGEEGFVVPVKSPEALAEKIGILIDDPDLRRRMGQKGRKLIEERNNYRKEMAKMNSIYLGLGKAR